MSGATRPRRRRVLKLLAGGAVVATAGLGAGLYAFANVSLRGDEAFERRLDEAIGQATDWIRSYRWEITRTGNVAMYMLLQDCYEMHPEPLLGDLVDRYLQGRITPACWRRVLDREHPVDRALLNRTIEGERIDNRWMLYAIAPDEAELSEPDMQGLLDRDRWHGRQLTHQLMALIRLRDDGGSLPGLDDLIEALCARLSRQLRLDLAVVDLYIQKVAVVLDAGHAEMVNRRWVDRVIDNQRADGGWNDRWCRVFTSFRKPALDLADPPSDQHATIQALWLLYQVRHRHAQRFGLRQRE